MTSAGDSVTQQAKTTAKLIREGGDHAALFAAAALGQRAMAQRLLAADPALAQARTPDGKTPLHLAAQWGQLELAQLLLDHGASATAADAEGRTPLHAQTGHATRLDLLERLIAHGADPNVEDHFGNAPLFLAASLIHQAGHDWGAHDWLAEALLRHGARLDAFTAVILNREGDLRAQLAADPALILARKRHGYIPDGSTLLHFAADRGHAAVTRALLEHGADLAATDSRGRPPLYLAGHNAGARKPGPTPAVVELLLAAGAPLDVFAAALLGRLPALEHLVSGQPTLAQAADAGGSTPLHLAAWNGQAEAAAWLLDHGAPVDAANARGETPLSLAAGYNHQPVVELLLAQGAVCRLFTAIGLARPDLVQIALASEPAAAVRPNRYGRTPVQQAAEAAVWAHTFGAPEAFERHQETLRVLHTHGAPAEVWSAIVLDQAVTLSRLLDETPSLLNVQDNGNTPLHIAAALGRADLAELLVARGAALEARDFSGATPLRRAAGFIPGLGPGGSAATAAVLLRHGANRQARNNWSDTPVGVALGTPAVTEVMLAHGADLTIWAAAALGRGEDVARFIAADPMALHAPGDFGFTPLNWAVANGHAALVADLLDRGAPDPNTWGRSLVTWAEQCGQAEVASLLRARGLT